MLTERDHEKQIDALLDSSDDALWRELPSEEAQRIEMEWYDEIKDCGSLVSRIERCRNNEDRLALGLGVCLDWYTFRERQLEAARERIESGELVITIAEEDEDERWDFMS
jgi:hypothetical protein